MGKTPLPHHHYFIYKASKILNCSFIELYEHEDRLELMNFAFTVSNGESDGEYLLKVNPEYKTFVKNASKKMEIK